MNLLPSGERLRALPASISGGRIDSGEPEEVVHPLHPGRNKVSTRSRCEL